MMHYPESCFIKNICFVLKYSTVAFVFFVLQLGFHMAYIAFVDVMITLVLLRVGTCVTDVSYEL